MIGPVSYFSQEFCIVISALFHNHFSLFFCVSGPELLLINQRSNFNFSYSWLGCVESRYSLSLSKKPELAPRDDETTKELQEIPANWSNECDEQLVNFLSSMVDMGTSNLGTIKNYVDQISVSSSCVRFMYFVFRESCI